MPNIRSQSITPTSITIVSSNGNSVTLTFADVLAHFATETGNVNTRRANTIAWAKQQIVNALGSEIIKIEQIDQFDFVNATGRITRLRIRRG